MTTINMGQLPPRATLIRVDAEDRFVVPVSNAMITDAIGLLVSGVAFFASDSFFFKLIALGGAAWMGTALVTKIPKLVEGPQLTLQRAAAPAMGYTPRWNAPDMASCPCNF